MKIKTPDLMSAYLAEIDAMTLDKLSDHAIKAGKNWPDPTLEALGKELRAKNSAAVAGKIKAHVRGNYAQK